MSAHDCVDLNLDVRALILAMQLSFRAVTLLDFCNGDALKRFFDFGFDATERGFDIAKRDGAFIERHIGQVNIDGKARKISFKEVDRCAAFECEHILLRDQR